MSVIEKLKEAVKSVVEAERQNLYAEARLNDGRVIATEAEAFSAGAPVRVMSEEGEATPLEAGSYELSDGGEVTVDADSKVVEMMEDKEEKTEAAEHEEEEKDEMAQRWPPKLWRSSRTRWLRQKSKPERRKKRCKRRSRSRCPRTSPTSPMKWPSRWKPSTSA
jgi:hypothetical protein